MKVQLVFFDGCPNVGAARRALVRALEAEGIAAEFEEIDNRSDDAPPSLAGWGSPTILINGTDVAGEHIPDGSSCRLYENPDNRGVPPDDAIRQALKRSRR